ncbi:peptidase domain-containing ABC transporter [Porticoccus sp. W117]|uniref:peptidase domain-containing ABC transporter n=1 Tax=Porticoccus sp. W117 TaxID=3054777 RepID=UPI00259A1226|nr:peptidase domain-containing ABC transporter [Porticoccus sp. W117]MDM3871343.1 peptidase domain-containing ABC transporter [Porticoccus sp. W117]
MPVISDAANSRHNPSNLLRFSGRKRLPLILQSEVAECGLACLAMVANFYGYRTDLPALRRKFSISLKGATLRSLMQIGEQLGMRPRALRLELEELSELQTPCILHWDMNHFVVLKSIRGNKAIIHDPGTGVHSISLRKMGSHFTGVALELSPIEKFSPQQDARKLRLKEFWAQTSGLKGFLIQLLVLSLVLQGFALLSPFYMQWVVDEVLLSHDKSLLLVLALGFGLLMLLNVMVTAFRSFVVMYLGASFSFQVANNLLRHMLRLPLSFFESRHIGDIVSRFGSLGSVKELLTNGLIEGIIDGLMVVATLILMFLYSPTLTFVVLAAVVIYFGLRLALFRPLRQLTEEEIVAGAKEDSNFMETIRAMEGIKSFGRESDRQHLWQNCSADRINLSVRIGKWNISFNAINGLLFGIENIVVIYLAATMVLQNSFTVGMLYAFMSYKGQFSGAISGLVDKVIQFKMLGLHLQRLSDIALEEPELVAEQEIVAIELGNNHIKGRLELCGVGFSYSNDGQAVLQKINLVVVPGESIAIVGPSGGGKTTLLKVAAGLFRPTSGTVKIDGLDVRQMGLKNYRRLTASVMQDGQLLSGSLADNICFFDPEADQEKIQRCAQLASIHRDIVSMPMGYNSLIGDMGSSLSGGQKQRVLLARALYADPKILFLDEATSHLDPQAEIAVNEAIKKLNITRIVVAHRQETIQSADRVFVLVNGEVKEVTYDLGVKAGI